jgi:hypothetical protein
MESNPTLEVGSQIRCPHCHRWHRVVRKYAVGTDYTRLMLMWECRGGFYFAGHIGGISRFPTRTSASDTPAP